MFGSYSSTRVTRILCGFGNLFKLDDFSNYRTFGCISAIYGKKIKMGNTQIVKKRKLLSVIRQALTNQLVSNARSRTPVLQYLFVNVLPHIKIIVSVDEAENILHAFIRAYCFLDQSQYAYGFFHFSGMLAMCLK